MATLKISDKNKDKLILDDFVWWRLPIEPKWKLEVIVTNKKILKELEKHLTD